jgi:hypothetical protein
MRSSGNSSVDVLTDLQFSDKQESRLMGSRELYIGGFGLACGYLNCADLTTALCSHPFDDREGNVFIVPVI